MSDSVYEEQLSAAKFRAERDMARQEVKELREELDAASKDAAERSKILEAARWVRDHGGLAHIMDIVNDFRAVVERIGVEWSESELHAIMGVLDSRLMPEGMEWPRYDTGEKVELGCQIATSSGGGEVCGIEFNAGGICVLSTEGVNGDDQVILDIENGERVKRPAVLAFDDDGCCNLGTYRCQEAAFTCDSCGHTVFVDKCMVEEIRYLRAKGIRTLNCCCGHDGKAEPFIIVNEGDECRMLNMGYERHVNEHGVTYFTPKSSCPPKELTHTKPEIDSWERIEDDARLKPFGYVDRVLGWDMSKSHSQNQARSAMTHDLVHRCRALAERERGE